MSEPSFLRWYLGGGVFVEIRSNQQLREDQWEAFGKLLGAQATVLRNAEKLEDAFVGLVDALRECAALGDAP